MLVFQDSGFRNYIQRSDDVCMRSMLQLTGVVIWNAALQLPLLLQLLLRFHLSSVSSRSFVFLGVFHWQPGMVS